MLPSPLNVAPNLQSVVYFPEMSGERFTSTAHQAMQTGIHYIKELDVESFSMLVSVPAN